MLQEYQILFNLLQKHSLNLVDDNCEGIIGIELKNKQTNYTLQVYACYLPPVDSPYTNTTSFFGHLITQIYLNSHVDMFILAGDFNARIGTRQDFIEQVDSISKRNGIDKSVNSYCDTFLEFLMDIKMCTLNGRVTPQFDNFTCLNKRGNSVVDYIITEHKNVNQCVKSVVYNVNDLIVSPARSGDTMDSSSSSSASAEISC